MDFYWHGEQHGMTMVYRHVGTYWEVMNVRTFYFGNRTGPDLWLEKDGTTHEIQRMFINSNHVDYFIKYRKDGSLSLHKTFNDDGQQIRTLWSFWPDGSKSEEVPYVDGWRKGKGGHFHEPNGEPSIVRFWERDMLQGRSRFYALDGRLVLVHVLKDNRILDLIECEPHENIILRNDA